MSSHLPEDLNSWPTDPYELFGVAPGVEPRDLRRAYTRLIRQYKPEQHPEHFRRIRSAYEGILRHVEFFQQFRQAEETPSADPDLPAFRPVPTEPEPPSLDDEIADTWRQFARGDETAAYARLLDLRGQQETNISIYIRLYWMLALCPALDAERSPCHWLAVGLALSGLSGPFRELYRRAILDDPAEALTERCAGLLNEDARAGAVADLAEWRWQAAGRKGRWLPIAGDLERLRGRILGEDEEIWLRLLLSAVEQLLPFSEQTSAMDVVNRCLREIDHLDHLHSRVADGLDRLEFLCEVASGWRNLCGTSWAPPRLTELLPLSFSRPFVEIRPLLLGYLEQLSAWPLETLRSLDAVKKQAPAVLTYLSQLFALIQETLPALPAADPEAWADGLYDFLHRTDGADYLTYRQRLLAFCTEAGVPSEALTSLSSGYQELTEQVMADTPLRLVCWGVRLFGA